MFLENFFVTLGGEEGEGVLEARKIPLKKIWLAIKWRRRGGCEKEREREEGGEGLKQSKAIPSL